MLIMNSARASNRRAGLAAIAFLAAAGAYAQAAETPRSATFQVRHELAVADIFV